MITCTNCGTTRSIGVCSCGERAYYGADGRYCDAEAARERDEQSRRDYAEYLRKEETK